MGMYIDIIGHNKGHVHFLNKQVWLPGVIYRASLANHTDLDLPGIVKAFFDFVGDIASQAIRGKLVDFFRFNDDTNLAAGLDSKRFFYAGKRVRDTLKRLQALDIQVDGFTPGARASR